MNINLIFDTSNKSMDLIKLSALYYDKVNILYPNTDSEHKDIFKVIINNGINFDEILELTKNGIVSIEPCGNYSLFPQDTPQTINNYYIGKDEDCFSVVDFINNNIGYEGRLTDTINRTFCIYRHVIQLSMFYESLSNNRNIITGNDIISECIELISNKYIIKSNKISLDLMVKSAIPILLPKFYEMSFEDIVVLRELAKDELEEMRHYINSLSLEYSPDDKKLINLRLHLKNKINPAIKQLESKVYGLKVGTIQKALQNLKDPLTYTPLLTTFFADIPAHISLALSMGLIAVETGMEYLKQKKEIETDLLYFSVKLRNEARKLQ